MHPKRSQKTEEGNQGNRAWETETKMNHRWKKHKPIRNKRGTNISKCPTVIMIKSLTSFSNQINEIEEESATRVHKQPKSIQHNNVQNDKIHGSQWTYLKCLFEPDLIVLELPFFSKNQPRHLYSSASTLPTHHSRPPSVFFFSFLYFIFSETLLNRVTHPVFHSQSRPLFSALHPNW